MGNEVITEHQKPEIEDQKIKDNLDFSTDSPGLTLALWGLPVDLFLRFAVVGLGGVAIDLGVFALVHNWFGLGLTLSAIISTEVAIINNFLWNDVWTFGDVSKNQPAISQRLQRFFKFNRICSFRLILNGLIVNRLVDILGMNKYFAKLVAIACVTLWNFWLNTTLNWRVRIDKNGTQV